MGTLASELGSHVERLSPQPRVYVDANVPAGLVGFMRTTLHWDVLFVIEHDDRRRARDGEHYRLARQLRRTLITLDRDYLDDRRFPMRQSGGVVVMAAPAERGFIDLLWRLHREPFHGPKLAEHGSAEGAVKGDSSPPEGASLPLEGRKLHVHVDWGRESQGHRLG